MIDGKCPGQQFHQRCNKSIVYEGIVSRIDLPIPYYPYKQSD